MSIIPTSLQIVANIRGAASAGFAHHVDVVSRSGAYSRRTARMAVKEILERDVRSTLLQLPDQFSRMNGSSSTLSHVIS